MKKPIVAIKDGGQFVRCVPYVYDETLGWILAKPYVRNLNAWERVGGAGILFYHFLDHNGLEYNSTNAIQVREQTDLVNIVSADQKQICIHTIPGNNSSPALKLLAKEQILYTLIDSNNNELIDNLEKTLVVKK